MNAVIKAGKNPYFVKELKSGYVVLGDYQFYKGYTLFLSKIHVKELHFLGSFRNIYLEEMAVVAEAVFETFRPNKINYELLGNTDNHLHWHIFPRYLNDPNPTSPVWVLDEKIRNATNVKPTKKDLVELSSRLNKSIDALLKP